MTKMGWILELEHLIGYSIHEIHPYNVAICMIAPMNPEWMHNRPGLYDLPRVDTGKLDIFVAERFDSEGAIAERIRWIVENLCGPWHYTHCGFYFGKDIDATMYLLRWK